MSTEVTVKKEQGLSMPTSGGNVGIAGVEGFDMTDLPMPFVKLVHGTSKNVELSTGGRANPGTWFHTTKREAKNTMDVVFFYAQKGQFPDLPKHPEEMIPGVKVLAVDLDDLENPFAMQFTKGGYWAYKRLLGAMKSWKVTKLYERYVHLDSKTVESQQGDEFLVPTMELSDELSPEKQQTVALIAESFSGQIDEVIEEPEEEIKEVKQERKPRETVKKYSKCIYCGNMAADKGNTHKRNCPNYLSAESMDDVTERTKDSLDEVDLGVTFDDKGGK